MYIDMQFAKNMMTITMNVTPFRYFSSVPEWW